MVAPMTAGAVAGANPNIATATGTGAVPIRTAAKLSILVVDDDSDVREFFQDFLTADGYDVTTLDDPTAAVERIRDEVFHLVVLDLMMPKLSGLELLAQIRAVDDDIAVVIVTGHPSLASASASIQHDVSAYLPKPCSPAEFREVIGRIAKKKNLVLRKEDELHAAIGRQIRGLRNERRLTLRHMSRRTNLSVSLLSQIERAESSASVSSLFKVASALGVPLTDLFAGF
jgi:DNA-binding NtrC family response regulator